LRDIWLSFLPGAKIGVLGLNGAGKSTLLRIMAGADKEFGGEAWAAEGATIGLSVAGAGARSGEGRVRQCQRGLAETKALVERFEAVSARFAEELSDDEMNDLIAEQGELQEQIDHLDAWELDRTIEIAMDALRCPPGDTLGREFVGRRAAPGRAVPAAVAEARFAAARRADQPSRRRVGRLAAALPEGLSRHRRHRHPRPLFPRRGRRLDPRIGSRPRHPL
jgi:ABC-type glutathione transport system ATPase component